MGEFVSVGVDAAGVATVRLDRAPVNALSRQVWAELGEAAVQCGADDAIKAVVLWGGPKVFCAGADIKEMQAMGLQEALSRAGGLQRSLDTMARVPKVVIAAISGYALGGGMELALTADFRYAASNARLGQPEIKLGLIPGAGGTQRLTRLVGASRAKAMVYGGDLVNAQECQAMGLVDQVFEPEEVYDRAVDAARGYAQGPFALRLAKRAIDEGRELDLDAALRLETTLFAACFGTDDGKTGMASFVEHGPGKAEFTQR